MGLIFLPFIVLFVLIYFYYKKEDDSTLFEYSNTEKNTITLIPHFSIDILFLKIVILSAILFCQVQVPSALLLVVGLIGQFSIFFLFHMFIKLLVFIIISILLSNTASLF